MGDSQSAQANLQESQPLAGGSPGDFCLVDSHCHIVFRNFDDDIEEVAERWRQAGVKALVHACV